MNDLIEFLKIGFIVGFIAVLALFLIRAGGSLTFNEQMEVSNISPYKIYTDKIDRGYSVPLRQLAQKITEGCPSNDKDCQVVSLYHYVQSGINYLADPQGRDFIQNPSETLQIKGGDCEDLSILLMSLLVNVGIETYMVFTPKTAEAGGHAYMLACGLNQERVNFFIEQTLLTKSSSKEINESYIVGAKKWRYWPISISKPTEIQYTVAANRPVDVMVFTSVSELQQFLNGYQAKIFPCPGKNLLNISGSCLVQPGSVFAVLNNDLADITANVHIKYISQQLQANSNFNMMQTYNVNEKQCIALDPAIKGNFVIPGQEAPFVKNASKTIIGINGDVMKIGNPMGKTL